MLQYSMNDYSVEDIFIDFFQDPNTCKNLTDQKDYSAAQSFYYTLTDNRLLTRNQSNYILKILKNNKYWLEAAGFDAESILNNPRWKNEFRIIDTSKRLSVSADTEGRVYYEFKFPYSLKEVFENEIFSEKKQILNSIWDHDNRIRKLPFYEHDIIKVLEFAKKHHFEVDQEIFDLEDRIESVWNQSENIAPQCVIENNQVVLKNANYDTLLYWESHKKGEINNDLLLAKHMGYCLNAVNLSTSIETIASSTLNSFWITDINKFLDLYLKLDTKICFLLGNNNSNKEWIQHFIELTDCRHIPRSDIKVCFRENKNQNTGFNEWIKAQGVGGSIQEGKIFLFNNAPAKWLYKDLESYKIIATNMIIPPVSQNTKLLLESHPCVMYVSDIKPTKMREINLVNL